MLFALLRQAHEHVRQTHHVVESQLTESSRVSLAKVRMFYMSKLLEQLCMHLHVLPAGGFRAHFSAACRSRYVVDRIVSASWHVYLSCIQVLCATYMVNLNTHGVTATRVSCLQPAVDRARGKPFLAGDMTSEPYYTKQIDAKVTLVMSG